MTMQANGQRSAEVVPATGATEVLIQAITAKMAGQISDTQFNAILTGVGAVPPPRQPLEGEYVDAIATPVTGPSGSHATAPRSRWQLLYAWLSGRPVIGTGLVIVALTVVGLLAYAVMTGLEATWRAFQQHSVAVGVWTVIGLIVVLVYKALSVQGRCADADLASARRPVVIHGGPRGDES